MYKKHKKTAKQLLKKYNFKLIEIEKTKIVEELNFSTKDWKSLALFMQGYDKGIKICKLALINGGKNG